MKKGHRLLLYSIGFVLGCILVAFMPRPCTVDREQAATEIAAQTGRFPHTFADSRGTPIRIDHPPRRIVSLAPSITEIHIRLGLANRLVGVTRHCPRPDAQPAPFRFDSIEAPDPERILSLNPDLVLLTPMTPPAVAERIRRSGITVAALDQASYESICNTVRILGRINLCEEKSNALLAQWEASQEHTRQRVKDLPSPTVGIFYDTEPLFTASNRTWIGRILRDAGGANIAPDSTADWFPLPNEALVKADPEVILFVEPNDGEASAGVLRKKVEEWKSREPWRSLKAVKSGKVHLLPGNLFYIPGPGIPSALDQLARAMHPEAYPETEAPKTTSERL